MDDSTADQPIYPSTATYRTGDVAERLARKGRTWIGELRRVDYIEAFCAELGIETFINLQVLEKGKLKLEVTRPAEDIAASVAEDRSYRLRTRVRMKQR